MTRRHKSSILRNIAVIAVAKAITAHVSEPSEPKMPIHKLSTPVPVPVRPVRIENLNSGVMYRIGKAFGRLLRGKSRNR